MTKPFYAGKTDLKKKFKLFLLLLLVFFVFCAGNLFAQIDLNGFGSTLQIPIKTKIKNIVSYDVDKDGYVDLSGIDSSGNYLYVFYGTGINKFSEQIRYKLNKKSDKIFFSDLISEVTTNLISLSKLSGYAEIYSFRRRTLSKKYSSFIGINPGNIWIGNLDNDQKKEILIYGENFSGLLLLKVDSIYNVKSEKLDFFNNFSIVKSIRVNNQSLNDLVTVIPRSYRILILRNLGNLKFVSAFTKKFNFSVSDINIFDFNEDRFQDIMVIFNEINSLLFLKGSGLGGFEENYSVKTAFNPSLSVVSDFTKDNRPDLIYYDFNSKNFFIKIMKEDHTYAEDIPLFRDDKIIDIGLYRTRRQSGIVINSINEKRLILNSPLISEEMDLCLSVFPSDLRIIKDRKYPYGNIFFIDKFDNSLVIIKQNEYYSPGRYFKQKLSKYYSDFRVNSKSDNIFEIAFYDKNKKFIEYFRIDINKGQYTRKDFTLKGNIISIKFIGSSEDNTNNLSILYSNDKGYFISILCTDCIKNNLYEEYISKNKILDFIIYPENSNTIYYWIVSESGLPKLLSKNLYEGNLSRINYLYSSPLISNPDFAGLFKFDEKIFSGIDILSVISNKNSSLLLWSNFSNNRSKSNIIKGKVKINGTLRDIFIYELKRLYYFDSLNSSVRAIQVSKILNSFITDELIKIYEPNSFGLYLTLNKKINLYYVEKNGKLIKRIIL